MRLLPVSLLLVVAVGLVLVPPSVLAAETEALSVSVELLSGQPVEGRLSLAAIDRIELTSGNQRSSFLADLLPVVKFKHAPAAQPPGAMPRATADRKNQTWGRIETIDGSSVPITKVVLSDSGDEFLLHLPTDCLAGPAEPCTVAADQTLSVRLPRAASGTAISAKARALAFKLQSQWAELCRQGSSEDLLVTVRRDGQALRFLEGFIEAMDAETVTLVLDDEPLEIAREKVYGIIIGQPDEAQPRDELSSSSGPLVSAWPDIRLTPSSMQLHLPSRLAVETTAGVRVSLPLSNVHSIDYTAGRIAYLSDLEPLASRHRPLFGTPKGLPERSAPRAAQPDRSYWGGELRIASNTASGRSKDYAKGIAVRSGSEISYQLDRQFRRLQGEAALAPGINGPRTLRLLIEGDGKTLLDEKVTHLSPPLKIDLDCKEVRQLKIILQREESLDATLHFGDARLVR